MGEVIEDCPEKDKDIPIVFKIIGRIDNHI